MDLNQVYSLAPQVAIRPERFGGLIYRHDNRKLYFLNSRVLVELLNELDGTQPLSAMLEVFVKRRGLGPDDRQALETGLVQLEGIGILHEL
jgi:putative mycofactocin binding protein MftB